MWKRCDYSILLWFTFSFSLLECPALFLCLHPITFFSLPVNLHFSLPLFLSAFNSRSFYFSLPLPLFLFLCLCWTQFLSLYIQLHFSLLVYINFSLTVSFAGSDSKYFYPFLFLALPLFVYASLFFLSVSALLHLFLSLSVSICLSGQVGFSEGCTLTWWNGVSLFLQWWRHFAVRITTPDIDGEEGKDLGVTMSWQKERWSSMALHASAVGTVEYMWAWG